MKRKELSVLGVFRPFMRSRVRYAVLYGGAGAGKSVAAAQKMVLRALAEPGARLLCVRKVKATIRNSVWAQLLGIIDGLGIRAAVQARVSLLSIRFGNGSEILCVGLDDAEKLKSIQGISSVWVEEATEISAADFLQLELRVRGATPGYKQFVLTFNPVDQGHWLYGRFFSDAGCGMRDAGGSDVGGDDAPIQKYGLQDLEGGSEVVYDGDDAPIQKYGLQSFEGGRGARGEDVLIVHATAADNAELDAEYSAFLERELRAEGDLYRIYALGLWGYLRRGGEFYKHFSIPRHVAPVSYDPDLRLHLSFDFNLHPYMTCTVWQVAGREFRQIGEICLESPRNSTVELGREIAVRFKDHRAGMYLYGDPTGHQIGQHGLEGRVRYSHYRILERELAHLHAETRAARKAPALVHRNMFINYLLEGRLDQVWIQIDPSCTHSIEDLQHIRETEEGKKLKAMYTHPTTGARCQQYGHTSDAMDYFLCTILREPFDAYFTGSTQARNQRRQRGVDLMLAARIKQQAVRSGYASPDTPLTVFVRGT